MKVRARGGAPVGSLEPFGDLGESRMASDDRRAAGGRGLGGNHPERLGEDRRHDDRIHERDQVDEMAVLERAGEERPLRRERLESRAVVAEADDDSPSVETVERFEQEVDALVVEQLAEVENSGPVAGEEPLEPGGVALVGEPLVRVTGIWRIAATLVEQSLERLLARPRTNSSTSTPGGTSWTFSTVPTTSSSTARMCAEPTKTASAVASAAQDSATSSLRSRIEYSSSDPCALTAKRAPVAAPTAPPGKT